MKTKSAVIIFVIIMGAVIISAGLRPLLVHESTKAGKIVESQNVGIESAFSLVEMSQILSPSEVCHAGLFKEFDWIDVKSVAPNLEGYQKGSTDVFWSWDFVPASFERRGATLYALGRKTTDSKVYFTLLSRKMTSGLSQLEVEVEK